MSKRRGLGRGLGALIPTDQDEETTPKSSGIQTVKVEQIQPNPHQPRTLMEETKLNELAGKPLPESFGQVITPMGEYDAPLLASPRKWAFR